MPFPNSIAPSVRKVDGHKHNVNDLFLKEAELTHNSAGQWRTQPPLLALARKSTATGGHTKLS